MNLRNLLMRWVISKLNFAGDRDINLRMKERLNNFTFNEKNKNV